MYHNQSCDILTNNIYFIYILYFIPKIFSKLPTIRDKCNDSSLGLNFNLYFGTPREQTSVLINAMNMINSVFSLISYPLMVVSNVWVALMSIS